MSITLEAFCHGPDHHVGYFTWAHVEPAEMIKLAQKEWEEEFSDPILDPALWAVKWRYAKEGKYNGTDDFVPYEWSDTPKAGYLPITFAVHPTLEAM